MKSEIYIDNYRTLIREQMNLIQKRADNVKIVKHPIEGTVYVCPYPPSHYPELKAEADNINYHLITK